MADEFNFPKEKVFEYLKKGVEVTDEMFNSVYPKYLRKIAETHFTHVQVARFAAQFLVRNKATKVLDIGSGGGKFCMVGATLTEGQFTGVEIRKKYFRLSQRIVKKFQLENINFIHSNITAIDFADYDAFYFFNPFWENIMRMEMMDDSVDLKIENYVTYSIYVKNQLEKMPIGTRLVTYFSAFLEVPDGYKKLAQIDQEKITFWEKVEAE